MRLALVLSILLAASCKNSHDHDRASRPSAPPPPPPPSENPVARAVGRGAYKASTEAGKIAKKAGKELGKGIKEAAAGWNDARRDAKVRQTRD